MNRNTNHNIIVIGHKNPDTDSICSAIAYARLQNTLEQKKAAAAPAGAEKTESAVYEPCRAGAINNETEYVLRRFGFEPPRLCIDVRADISDLEYRSGFTICSKTSMRDAWNMMRDNKINTLPVVHRDGTLEGIITTQDIAMANMDSLDAGIMTGAGVPLSNLLETIHGELIVGAPDAVIDRGNIVVAAGSPEVMEENVKEGDIVVVANRYEAQLCAIELGASVLIVCLAPNIARTIVRLAEEHHCLLINTPYDTYTASRLINQSIPVGNYMTRDVLAFHTGTPLEEVRETMSRVRYHYFPILNEDGGYRGLISRRNLLNYRKKRLVLVDHNEKGQCVDGFEEAEILGIIDHHRIGDMETLDPIYFRNQPVGCTASILYDMYRENDIPIPEDIAGILCCAIISDTLLFRSPTCTARDRQIAASLAETAHVDLDKLAEEMFDAGENLDGKTPDSVFHTDCKTLHHDGLRMVIAQGTFISENNRQKAEELVRSQLEDILTREGADLAFYVATSIRAQSSDVLFAGQDAAELLKLAFDREEEGGLVHVEGLVSRKKQFVPGILSALDRRSEKM